MINCDICCLLSSFRLVSDVNLSQYLVLFVDEIAKTMVLSRSDEDRGVFRESEVNCYWII